MKRSLRLGIIAAALLSASAASAAPISIGSTGSYTLQYDNAAAQWSGMLSIDVTSLTTSALTAVFTMSSDADNYVGSRLISFGMNFSPDVTGASGFVANQDGGTTEFVNFAAAINSNYPGGFTVDVCAYTGSNCNGGGSTGLLPGVSDAFQLTLTRSASQAAWSLASAPVKIQAGPGRTSHEFDSCTLANGCGSTSVPLPGTVGLLGLGAVALGFAGRRRRAS